VLDGYNVCIFAYGQTGSGKTYTMDGDSTGGKDTYNIGDNSGVSPRALAELFRVVASMEDRWSYRFTLSILEIYNETIRDLLGAQPSKQASHLNQKSQLDVRQGPDGRNVVPGLTEVSLSLSLSLWYILLVVERSV
jgi:kinesin family protein C2/C3